MSNYDYPILIVDDDEIILLALRENLTQQGYTVHTTQNPVYGLERVREEHFAIIICDQRMAEMNGLEFLRLCKEIQPEASRVLITGVLTIKTLIEAINKSEIFRFVAKPWTKSDLLQVVREAVQRHQLWLEKESQREEQEALIARLQAQSGQGGQPCIATEK